ncbi:hypothetical protein HIM_05179 [Hirsutella minnesotensis 3608]|uniref:Uncharacterized protein n=1 Tax=Hirsutella minnesotensis 3608 TaxID=1043627 RepID=A0A0F7ZUU7_9HYPO|nr:hypothetical protein HIM_05179 [Hirsutella minnesotensis 3608]
MASKIQNIFVMLVMLIGAMALQQDSGRSLASKNILLFSRSEPLANENDLAKRQASETKKPTSTTVDCPCKAVTSKSATTSKATTTSKPASTTKNATTTSKITSTTTRRTTTGAPIATVKPGSAPCASGSVFVVVSLAAGVVVIGLVAY